MMRGYFTFILLIVMAISCKENNKLSPPSDLISKEQFTAILADIRLLEGAYTTRYARVDSSALSIDSYYLKLFQDHGVSKERFTESYNWYALNQTKMLEIEEAVVLKLSEMQATSIDTSITPISAVDTIKPKVKVNQ